MGYSLYRFFDSDGQLLYVGITGVGPRRFSAHRHDKAWWHLVERIEVEHYDSQIEAAIAERDAIRDDRPRFNIAHAERREAAPVQGRCRWCQEPSIGDFCSARHRVLALAKEAVA